MNASKNLTDNKNIVLSQYKVSISLKWLNNQSGDLSESAYIIFYFIYGLFIYHTEQHINRIETDNRFIVYTFLMRSTAYFSKPLNMYRLHILLYFLCASFNLSSGKTKLPPNPINYITRKSLMTGLVFPKEIHAVVGEDIFFRIIEPINAQAHCFYRLADGIDRNVLTPHRPK